MSVQPTEGTPTGLLAPWAATADDELTSTRPYRIMLRSAVVVPWSDPYGFSMRWSSIPRI